MFVVIGMTSSNLFNTPQIVALPRVQIKTSYTFVKDEPELHPQD